MEDLLKKIGLQSLLSNFDRERVDINTAKKLSDTELARLGIVTIGERHSFRIHLETYQENDQHGVVSPSGSSARNLVQEITDERTRLFSSYGNRQSRSRSRRGTSRNKRTDRTFSRNFLCLASKNQEKIPTPKEKEVLSSAGLGIKRIKLSKFDTPNDILEKLSSDILERNAQISGFPKLQNAGGFELLRATQTCRNLELIHSAWSGENLQSHTNPQSTIYIRPIQHDLNCDPIASAEEMEEVKSKCNLCKKSYPIKTLRQHVESCEGLYRTNQGSEEISGNHEPILESNQRNSSSPGLPNHQDTSLSRPSFHPDEDTPVPNQHNSSSVLPNRQDTSLSRPSLSRPSFHPDEDTPVPNQHNSSSVLPNRQDTLLSRPSFHPDEDTPVPNHHNSSSVLPNRQDTLLSRPSFHPDEDTPVPNQHNSSSVLPNRQDTSLSRPSFHPDEDTPVPNQHNSSSVLPNRQDTLLSRPSFHPDEDTPVPNQHNSSSVLPNRQDTSLSRPSLSRPSFHPDEDTPMPNPVNASSFVPQEAVSSIVNNISELCQKENLSNPVEILRVFQSKIVTGRPLEIKNEAEIIEGSTNFILIDRKNPWETTKPEISAIEDLRDTLEVQFYDETALDFGGPRKEFFRIILREIKDIYFDKGLRHLLWEDYEVVGKIFALSVLQNGSIPTFMSQDVQSELFGENPVSPCIASLRSGLDALGVYQLCKKVPAFQFLFQPTTNKMTYRMLTTLLKPQFSEDGSNSKEMEKKVYAAFLRYLREVASGRRRCVTLGKVLQFTTSSEEEPVLGFELHPSIVFHGVDESFIPTANTCINVMRMPRPTVHMQLPEEAKLFELYDYAFSNTFMDCSDFIAVIVPFFLT
ncbi:hypothetical protein ScPMuIL_014706 [Solemya velum]